MPFTFSVAIHENFSCSAFSLALSILPICLFFFHFIIIIIIKETTIPSAGEDMEKLELYASCYLIRVG